MKTSEFKLPLEASREVALAIIDQLPQSEFSKVVQDIRKRSRDRALASLRCLRSAVRKSGLKRRDFTQALEEVRAEKAKKNPAAVLDTNVLISYLFGSDVCTRIIDSLENDSFIPAMSPCIEQEFLDTTRKPRIAKKLDAAEVALFLADWRSFVLYVKPKRRVVVCRDPDDNAALECALAANAAYIVSGDKDLLTLRRFEHIRILTPREFLHEVLRLT